MAVVVVLSRCRDLHAAARLFWSQWTSSVSYKLSQLHLSVLDSTVRQVRCGKWSLLGDVYSSTIGGWDERSWLEPIRIYNHRAVEVRPCRTRVRPVYGLYH